MNIIFLGTPEFSAKILRQLIASRHNVVAVVSQPDRPVGRKHILEPTPTKKVAEENNIKVFQFEKIRKQGVEILRELNADVMITVAYGQILSKELLELTQYGTINVHGSLLPEYRGAAPFQWALINGEKETGVTIMKSDVGIDDGPVFKMQSFNIEENDSLEDLYRKAGEIAPAMLFECLDKLESGEAIFTDQEEEKSSYYPMLKPELSYIDFNMPKLKLVNLIKGISDWPTAVCLLNGTRFNIYSAKITDNSDSDKLNRNIDNYQNGEVVECSSKKGIIVKVSDGFITLQSIQLSGGKKMDSKAFANGKKMVVGDILKPLKNQNEVL